MLSMGLHFASESTHRYGFRRLQGRSRFCQASRRGDRDQGSSSG
jgi:hypothetical protein